MRTNSQNIVKRCEASLQFLQDNLAFGSYSATFLLSGNFRPPPRAGSTCMDLKKTTKTQQDLSLRTGRYVIAVSEKFFWRWSVREAAGGCE